MLKKLLCKILSIIFPFKNPKVMRNETEEITLDSHEIIISIRENRKPAK